MEKLSMVLMVIGLLSIFGFQTLLGTIAAASSGSFTSDYVPQFITFNIDADPTAFKINVKDSGLTFDLDANGCGVMKNIRLLGIVANQYWFQIADGQINNRVTTYTITNASVGTALNLRGYSRKVGSILYQYLSQIALANSGITFQNFAWLGFPSAAAADRFNITYGNRVMSDGEQITGIAETDLDREDVNTALQTTQNEVATKYGVDNIEGLIQRVNFIPAAQQTVYFLRYIPANIPIDASLVQQAGLV